MKTIVCKNCGQYIGANNNGEYYIIVDIHGEWTNMETNQIPGEAKCVQCDCDLKENMIEEEVK